MRKSSIAVMVLFIIAATLFIPMVSSTSAVNNPVVVTYGETTYNNQNYKDMVDSYFTANSNVDMKEADSSIVTASDVNKISKDITQKSYSSNQIYSCALLDLSDSGKIDIDVDNSKITTVTASMYRSALDSAGITTGHVVVTSPVTATGESALAGIMKSYETATNIEIPEEVKEAANEEIYTQAEIVENTNASADAVADLFTQVKDEVARQNTTDRTTIINIITNIASNNNINISENDINNLAESVEHTQAVQDQAAQYQSQISEYLNSDEAQSFFDQLWSFIQSILNSLTSQNV